MREEEISSGSWQDSWVREKVERVNPILFQTLEKINPGQQHKLYFVRYSYGNHIFKDGAFQLPYEGKLYQVLDYPIDSIRKDFLGYKTDVPVSLITKNSTELFVEKSGGETLPWFLYHEGDVMGLWKRFEGDVPFHPVGAFKMTSGTRHVFSVPDIGVRAQHNKMCFDARITVNAPKELYDHWKVFKALANSPVLGCDWTNEIMLMPWSWVDAYEDSLEWVSLQNYLLRYFADSCSFWKNSKLYAFAISCALEARGYRQDAFLIDAFDHLIAALAGSGILFSVATDEKSLPLSFLQKSYLELYKLRDYEPTILKASYYSPYDEYPSYYSFKLPCQLEFTPSYRKVNYTSEKLLGLKRLIDMGIENVISGNLKLDDTVAGNLLKNVYIRYFHSRPGKAGETGDILNTSLLPEYNSLLQPSIGKEFAHGGSFFKGCVQISKA